MMLSLSSVVLPFFFFFFNTLRSTLYSTLRYGSLAALTGVGGFGGLGQKN